MARNSFGSFPSDLGEQLLELGQSTAKGVGKGLVQTFNPMQVFDKNGSAEKTAGKDGNSKMEEAMKEMQKKGDNHTKVNFDELQKKYAEQDKVKMEAMRSKLFQLVKTNEQKAIEQLKQEELERQRQMLAEEEEKKRKLAAQNQEPVDMPHGKVRKTIGQAQVQKSMEQRSETRAAQTNKG